jgi:hypothetical protein
MLARSDVWGMTLNYKQAIKQGQKDNYFKVENGSIGCISGLMVKQWLKRQHNL